MTFPRLWPPPPLPAEAVQVWRVWLDRAPQGVEALWRVLAPDERERAARFRFGEHRRRFIVARGHLRHLLASFLDVAPDAVRFEYGPRGKPALADPFRGSGLGFNISHSHEMALVALARRREVGVDVEHTRRPLELEPLAAFAFSENENQMLRALPGPLQPAAFFACWTRKEAYIKATGDGLAQPLGDFDVTLAPEAPPRLLRVAGKPDEVARWTFHHLEPAPDYVGALAVERGASVPVSLFTLDDALVL